MKFFKKATIFCLSLLTCCSLGLAAACENEGDTSSSGGSSSVNGSVIESTESNDDSSVSEESSEETSSSLSDSSVEDSSSEEDSSSPEQPARNYVYRVTVENQTGFGLRRVPVSLYDGETLVANATTNVNGYAYFRNEGGETIEVGTYRVELELPAGYEYANKTDEGADPTYATLPAAGTEVVIQLAPTGVITEGDLPQGRTYQLGDVMYDFTSTLPDGTKFNLAQTLEVKDLTVINFWATWCGPCKAEFPVMQNVLTQYADEVGCIAISKDDSTTAVGSFKKSQGITFNMAGNDAGDGLTSKVNLSGGIPVTLLVDRYGVIVFMHTGSITNMKDWQDLFSSFLGDDYVSTIYGQASDDSDNEGEDGNNRLEPTVPAPSLDDVHKVLGTTDEEFSLRWQAKDVVTEEDEGYDKYSWPWLVGKDGETDCLIAANALNKIHSSYATLYADFTAKAGDVLAFDYKVGSELDYDILYVLIDGQIVSKISGYQSDKWHTSYSYVFSAEEEGEHELSLLFLKDGDSSDYDDVVYIRNLRLETTNDGIGDADNALIVRQAAIGMTTEENATTQFTSYASLVFNEKDGYYHVDTKEGPILFADLWYATQWSKMSVWQLVDAGYCVVGGFDYSGPFEQYAWQANNNIAGQFNMHGLVPVTEELKNLLQILTEAVPYNSEWDNFDGAWHENEWLEICRYYQPYGNTAQLEDPMKTITFNAAVEIFAGVDNEISVPFSINPRGFKYKFIPETSGVYKVYSKGDADSFTFLVDSDQKTFLGEWDNLVNAETTTGSDGVTVADGNFMYYWYFEAGKTYYMLFTTFLDQPADYIVKIDYIGQTYTYKELAATCLYSANLVTGELFIPDAIDYAYDPNYVYDKEANDRDPSKGIGCYRHVDKNGEMGSVIYLDVLNPTTFSPTQSLYAFTQAQREIENIQDREFYLPDGQGGYKDYTDDIWKACLLATRDGAYIVVTEEIHQFLYALTVYSDHEGLDNTWLTLCYYDKTIGPQS